MSETNKKRYGIGWQDVHIQPVAGERHRGVGIVPFILTATAILCLLAWGLGVIFGMNVCQKRQSIVLIGTDKQATLNDFPASPDFAMLMKMNQERDHACGLDWPIVKR